MGRESMRRSREGQIRCARLTHSCAKRRHPLESPVPLAPEPHARGVMSPARRVALILACLPALMVSGAARLGAAPRTLPDSTVADTWQLPNGLRVTTRHVAGAPSVAMVLAFPFGTEGDPLKREGLATVAGYTFELAATSQNPERSEGAMERIRPQGWNVEVDRRSTRISEAVPQAQFPGALHEMALRLSGVQPTEPVLVEARRIAKDELTRKYWKRMDWALYHQLRALAAGDSTDRVDRYAQGSAVAKATLADVRSALHDRFVPSNAVLSLAGDLSGVDVHRFVLAEFGAIAAGRKLAPAPAKPLHGGARWSAHPDALDLVAALGIFAPPLDDSTHASFVVNSLCAGSFLTQRWGRLPEIPSRFRYSVVDDPELVVFFPPVGQRDADSLRIHDEFGYALAAFAASEITYEKFQELRRSAYWLIGGAMNAQQTTNARTNAGFLLLLAGSAASREFTGGESFWSGYRARFEATNLPDVQKWYAWYRDPTKQAHYFFNPGVAAGR